MSRPPKPAFKQGVLSTSTVSALADLADYATDPPVVIVQRLAVQSITNSVDTAIVFDSTLVANTGMFTPSSATITIVDGGVYTVSGWVDVAAGTTGIRQLEVVQNGTTAVSDARNAPSAFTNRMTITGLIICAAGDTLGLFVFQSQGSALNLTAARFGVVRSSG